MWLANLDNGESISSKSFHWLALRQKAMEGNKKVSAVQLFHPHIAKLDLTLKHMDFFYFTKEAICSPQSEDPSTPVVIAEIIGAHDLLLNSGVEIRLDYKGSVRVTVYALPKFKYDASILIPGFRPSTEA